jgi:hypothetical protein
MVIFIKGQFVMVVILAFQLYLAVSEEIVDHTLDQIQKVAQWPIQALNIGLFVLVLGICWLYLRSTRKDLDKLQRAYDDERKEYTLSLKQLVGDMGKIIERNNVIYDRIDRRLERIEGGSIGGAGIRIERPPS